ncbi:unnamed protein product [Lymnaea stagnalis]|uniref:Uncharacterized protein n=1 Tax=Lymnaea stagnalis TaxID=6523 RepID=A0AAV2GY39_LYMST
MATTSSIQNGIYRSVPPCSATDTFTDDMTTNRRQKSRTAPVYLTTPDDFAIRFKSQPTARPKIVELDWSSVNYENQRSSVQRFPLTRAKMYTGLSKTKSPLDGNQPNSLEDHNFHIKIYPARIAKNPRTVSQSPQTYVQFTPQTHRSDVRVHENKSTRSRSHTFSSTRNWAKSAGGVDHRRGRAFRNDAIREDVQRVDDDHVYNSSLIHSLGEKWDDLGSLPPPKKVVPKRDLPWVFRYKVNKGNSILSQIMASKPTQSNLPKVIPSRFSGWEKRTMVKRNSLLSRDV